MLVTKPFNECYSIIKYNEMCQCLRMQNGLDIIVDYISRIT